MITLLGLTQIIIEPDQAKSQGLIPFKFVFENEHQNDWDSQ